MSVNVFAWKFFFLSDSADPQPIRSLLRPSVRCSIFFFYESGMWKIILIEIEYKQQYCTFKCNTYKLCLVGLYSLVFFPFFDLFICLMNFYWFSHVYDKSIIDWYIGYILSFSVQQVAKSLQPRQPWKQNTNLHIIYIYHFFLSFNLKSVGVFTGIFRRKYSIRHIVACPFIFFQCRMHWNNVKVLSKYSLDAIYKTARRTIRIWTAIN